MSFEIISVSQNLPYEIDKGDTIILLEGVVIATGTDGIRARNGSSVESATVRVFGAIHVDQNALEFGELGNQSSVYNQNSVYVGASGVLSGTNGIYWSAGANNQLSNYGEIVGDDIGIKIDGWTNGQIVNHGMIHAGGNAIDLGISAVNGVIFTNTGTVSSAAGLSFVAHADSNGIALYNTGLMVGDIQLSDGKDVFDGRGGSVIGTVYGGAQNDTLLGGSGTDDLHGGQGSNWLDGGDGNDRLRTGEGNSTLHGRAGDDDITTTGNGNNRVYAGSGDDVVVVGDGNNRIKAASGDDTVTAGKGNDTIFGGQGDDDIKAGNGRNLVRGNKGDDQIITGGGKDSIFGGGGDDTLKGNGGADKVVGGAGDDVIKSGAGSDTVFGGSGDDSIDAEAGLDTVYGNDGDDTITGLGGRNDVSAAAFFGGHGNDVITIRGDGDVWGNTGNDTITGSDQGHANRIKGGAGDDHLIGGNFLAGGAGNDRIETHAAFADADMVHTIKGNDGDDVIIVHAGDALVVAATVMTPSLGGSTMTPCAVDWAMTPSQPQAGTPPFWVGVGMMS